MLQNKKFIALLIVLLVFVLGNNIRYFSNKGGGDVADPEEEVDTNDLFSEGIRLERGMSMETMEMSMDESGFASPAPRPPLQAQPLQLASMETLTESLPPFSLDGMGRNPFLTEKEDLNYRKRFHKKRVLRKNLKSNRKKGSQENLDQKVETQISSDSIKMIYQLGEEAYVWIRGRAWRAGETIGKTQILRITADSVLLEDEGERRTLFIDRSSEAERKGVQLHYEK